MTDESKNYTLVQGSSGSELSFTYNAENITIVQLLYQLDEAKKNKDSDAFEKLVNLSEAVFLQDKFNQLPLEDRMRLENLMEDQADLKDKFYEFKDEVMYEHFPRIESEFEAYRGLFENARNEIYESNRFIELDFDEVKNLNKVETESIGKEEISLDELVGKGYLSEKENVMKRGFKLVEKIGGVAVINLVLFALGYAAGEVSRAQTIAQFPEHANNLLSNNTISYIGGGILALLGDYIILSNWIDNE